MNTQAASSISIFLTLVAGAALPLAAATQTSYSGSNATGLLRLSGSVNVMQVARADAGVQASASVSAMRRLGIFGEPLASALEFRNHRPRHGHPRYQGLRTSFFRAQLQPRVEPVAAATVELGIVAGGGVSFNGLTHMDQRLANHGNQLSVEPPNPSIAVAKGYILEGVNNAIQVYDSFGNALLPAAIATNELFGLAPEYDRSSFLYGPYPTDLRVFYDADIERWLVLQRAQDEDIFGDELASSHLYLAVSKTEDPTGGYNIYTADTTDLNNPRCPCYDDYPQIGADRNGFYISSNQLNSNSNEFADANILALSKASLGAGAATPTVFRFVLPFVSGYEFSVQPATTPHGASYFLANGGVEYFASTAGDAGAGNSVAVWALSNTGSLAGENPNLTLVQTSVATLSYNTPDAASQPEGNRPYGESLTPPGPLPVIDAGDTRALSLAYAGARLYLTFATSALDPQNNNVTAGALVILSPSFRGGVVGANVLRQSYLIAPANNLLRPTVAVNPEGIGDIAATLVGPSIYPSAAFVPVSTFENPHEVHVAGAGTSPDDGFTGYEGIARWGDFSTAVAASDGSIWMAAEYIGDLPRTTAANWDTFITRSKP